MFAIFKKFLSIILVLIFFIGNISTQVYAIDSKFDIDTAFQYLKKVDFSKENVENNFWTLFFLRNNKNIPDQEIEWDLITKITNISYANIREQLFQLITKKWHNANINEEINDFIKNYQNPNGGIALFEASQSDVYHTLLFIMLTKDIEQYSEKRNQAVFFIRNYSKDTTGVGYTQQGKDMFLTALSLLVLKKILPLDDVYISNSLIYLQTELEKKEKRISFVDTFLCLYVLFSYENITDTQKKDFLNEAGGWQRKDGSVKENAVDNAAAIVAANLFDNQLIEIVPEKESEKKKEVYDTKKSVGGGGGGGGSNFFQENKNKEKIDTNDTVLNQDLENEIETTHPFIDIEKHWAKEYILKLYEQEIVQGRSKTNFSPDEHITRAELTKIVLLLFQNQIETIFDNNKNIFSDIRKSDWFYNYVMTAKQKQIIEGYKDKTFRPHQYITRAETLKIILKSGKFSLSEIEENILFIDVKNNKWFFKYINYASLKGIIEGYKDKTFRPHQYITRAEAVKILLLSYQSLSDI